MGKTLPGGLVVRMHWECFLPVGGCIFIFLRVSLIFMKLNLFFMYLRGVGGWLWCVGVWEQGKVGRPGPAKRPYLDNDSPSPQCLKS